MERAQGTRCSLGQTAGVLPPSTESEPLGRDQGHSQERNLFGGSPQRGPPGGPCLQTGSLPLVPSRNRSLVLPRKVMCSPCVHFRQFAVKGRSVGKGTRKESSDQQQQQK